MEPVEYREERVATPVAATPVADPVAVAGTPVARTAYGTGVVSRSVGVYPVGYRAIQMIWFIVGIINVVLALDFIFRLTAANNVGFARFIFALGRVFAAPFDGIFNLTVADGVYVARWSDLLAIAIYTSIGLGVTKLVRIMATPRQPASI